MHLKKVKKTALLLMALLCSQSALGAEKHALLIGIGDYSLVSGFSDLRGPRNDVAIMKKVLEGERFGFDHVTVLLDEQATHSRIEKAFKALAARTRAEDVGSVFIYFSGHGSQTRDLNGDEEQTTDFRGNALPGYDQTWVAYGSRLGTDAAPPAGFEDIDRYDILDDQIAKWTGDIAAGCQQVVFVSDSCHSGSVSRNGVAAGIRRAPFDCREHPLGKKPYEQVDSKNIVRIGASKDAQLAKEFLPPGATDIYGVFTWHWAKALEKCMPDDSWSHVFNRVSRIIYQETPNRQTPQISGAVNMKVFEADFLAPAQTVPVYRVLKKGDVNEVFIAAGLLSGVTVGSVYTLEDKAGRPDAPKIVIAQVKAAHSIGTTEANVSKYDQVVEIEHRYEFPPTRLLLKAEGLVSISAMPSQPHPPRSNASRWSAYQDASRPCSAGTWPKQEPNPKAEHERNVSGGLERLQNLIQKLEPYKIVNDEASCDLIVYIFRPDKSLPPNTEPASCSPNRKALPGSNQEAMPEIWVLDNNGFLLQDSLRHSCSQEGLEALRRNLLKLARIKDIMRVVSPEGPAPLELSVAPMLPTCQAGAFGSAYVPNDWKSEVCSSAGYAILEPMRLAEFSSRKWDFCTMLRFNAKNPTDRTYFFYVVYIGDNAEIAPVFPSMQESSQIAEVGPGAENMRGKALIRLDTKTLDRYKIIVCRRPLDHRLFFQSGTQLALRGAEESRQLNPLEKILLDAATGTRSAVSCEIDSWYAENIVIDMR